MAEMDFESTPCNALSKAILKKMFVCSNATDSQNLPLLKIFFHGLDKKNFLESENYALCFAFIL
jgi:hypothetical protein